MFELARYPRSWWRFLTRPQQVRLRGVIIEIPDDVPESIVRQIYTERYERGEARCINAGLQAGDVVLEVGGGIGFVSALCALRVGSDQVHTFEGNPALIDRIHRTYELNDVAPHLTNAMLGMGGRERPFYIESEFLSSSQIRRSEQAEEIVVPELNVNEVIARVKPTVIVMDIEGGEAELVPMIDWSSIRALVIELHPAVLGAQVTQEVIEAIESAGLIERRRVSSSRKKLFVRR
ncbi:MAG: FkbM family methyltransferase [bacterium]|nr:FkbM family methyltransferase [bacterium]